MLLRSLFLFLNVFHAEAMELTSLRNSPPDKHPSKTSSLIIQPIKSRPHFSILENPVTKFTSLKVEPILEYKDDNGFAPLKPRLSHIQSPYWNLKFHTYHFQLTNLFIYELQGHRAIHGIHFPPVLRYYQPIITLSKNWITVTLNDDRFNTIAPLGIINLKKHGWDTIEGLKFCVDFLQRFTLYDNLYIQFQKHKPKKIFEKKVNDPYWTEMDDYILSQLTRSPQKSLSLEENKEELNEEIIRKIGEFFKWRKILMDFIDQTSLDFFKEIKITSLFERHLIDQVHLEPKVAKKYSKVLHLKNAIVAMLMSPLSLDNEKHVQLVFDKFIKWKLIPHESLKAKYMEYFTG
jgi:hypothetical protein